MGYVSPSTQSASSVIPTSRLNSYKAAGDYLATNKPHCRVYNSSAISIPNNTATALTFNTERYDLAGCHSTGSNTSRLTVPTGEAGKFDTKSHVSWASSGTGSRQCYHRLNGSTLIAVDSRMPTTSGGGTEIQLSSDYALAAADYLETVVVQGSGGALNVNAASAYSPEMSWRWFAV